MKILGSSKPGAGSAGGEAGAAAEPSKMPLSQQVERNLSKPVEGSVDAAPLGRASQSRRDALTGRWAIFAPGRSDRPSETGDPVLPRQAGHNCPFCSGHERCTPAPTMVIRDPCGGAGEWAVRVVPNLFPAVSQCHAAESLLNEHRGAHRGSNEASAARGEAAHAFGLAALNGRVKTLQQTAADEDDLCDLFEVAEVHGGHEVVIETPHHLESLTDLSREQAGRVFQAYAARMRYWFDVPGVQYVVTFKNVGAAAGASLRHTHSQVIATSLLPPSVREIGQRVEAHHQRTGDCLMCATLTGELEDGCRIVVESDRFIAYCPFASRMPYLVRIAPRCHADRFELSSHEELTELAALVQRVLGSLESTFAACAYNYTIHTRPRPVAGADSFHWWMELFPRLTKVAGFEWGSDCYINPVPPEAAAEYLRREHCGRVMRAPSRKTGDFCD